MDRLTSLPELCCQSCSLDKSTMLSGDSEETVSTTNFFPKIIPCLRPIHCYQ